MDEEIHPFPGLTAERTREVMENPLNVIESLLVHTKVHGHDMTETQQAEMQLAIDMAMVNSMLAIGMSYDEAVDLVTDDDLVAVQASLVNGDIVLEPQYRDPGDHS